MKYLMPLLLLPALLLCAFGPGDPSGGPPEKPGKEEPKEEKDAYDEAGGTDSTDMMMQSYLDGQAKAMYLVQVHDDPAAGQYWETSYTMAGVGTTTTRWNVANVDGDTAIIEQMTMMTGDYSKYRYVLAYQVDLTKDESEGEANVTKAWIGKLGEEGKEIEVMEKPESTDGGEAPEYEMEEEEFTDVEMAGGTWSGQLTTIKGDGWEFKSWTADNGWFNGIIKTESSGMVTELVAFGDDGESQLKWEDAEEGTEEDKEDPVTGEKKEDEEKKEEEADDMD